MDEGGTCQRGDLALPVAQRHAAVLGERCGWRELAFLSHARPPSASQLGLCVPPVLPV